MTSPYFARQDLLPKESVSSVKIIRLLSHHASFPKTLLISFYISWLNFIAIFPANRLPCFYAI